MEDQKSKRWLIVQSPLILLVLALSTVFLFSNDRAHFYRSGHHNYVSSEHLANAVNFSSKHNFLGFTRQIILSDGNSWYDAHNRFPPGGYALIKLTTLPFESLSAQIYAARVLMLMFFVGTGVMAFRVMCRLSSDKWVALTATLVSFSSYYFLYYNDMISNEVAIDLFVVLVIFHSMVIFAQEGRFWQLVTKSCFALLFGWHVYGLLVAFIILGMAREAFIAGKTIQENGLKMAVSKRVLTMVSSGVIKVVTSRYMMLGCITLVWGVMILAYNMSREYFALNATDDIPLNSLPSFRSMVNRTGLDKLPLSDEAVPRTWFTFLRQQLGRIGVLATPFSFQKLFLTFSRDISIWISSLYTGIVLALCVVGASLVRYKMLVATLIMTGFCWAIPMRNNTEWHEYEAVFYYGIPLVFFTLVVQLIQRLSNKWLWLLVTVALANFIISAFQMSRISSGSEAVEFNKAISADFDAIRTITQGNNVLVPIVDKDSLHIEFVGVRHGLDYYLSGSGIILGKAPLIEGVRSPRYIIRRAKLDEISGLLTPENRLMFLYDLKAS